MGDDLWENRTERQICDSGCIGNGWVCPDVRSLKAALDEARERNEWLEACLDPNAMSPFGMLRTHVYLAAKAAADMQRERDEALGEVERLRTRIADIGRNLDWPEPEKATSADVLYAAFKVIKERDEARRDAVEVVEIAAAAVADQRYLPSDGIADRINAYRKAQGS